MHLTLLEGMERRDGLLGRRGGPAGFTVRALHHHDELGLVTATRAPNGHRSYDHVTLERLQQVLFFRRLIEKE